MSTLAAARADNFYYPPEWDPKKGGLNKFQKQHPLRERAKKIDQGILVIRFEMPFNTWCGGCESMIAKGVRFNAEKKQVGNYFSTKIWSFKMKSACCQHDIEIQTDPKACAYIVVSGGRQKAEEFEAEDAETQALPDKKEQEQLEDPLFKLEHVGGDKARAKEQAPRVLQLKQQQDARHADPWKRNRALRDMLRAQKKRVALEEAEARKLGLGTRLLPASEDDRKRASEAQFTHKFDVNLKTKRALIQASSIFGPSAKLAPSAKVEGGAGGKVEGKGGGKFRGLVGWGAGLTSGEAKGMGGGKEGGRKDRSRGEVVEATKGSESERRLLLVAKMRRMNPQGVLNLVSSGIQVSAMSR